MSILIGADTTFIVQGITGREAVNLTRECLDYGAGAKVVGGVTPGRLGREVHGVPVFDTIAQAVEAHLHETVAPYIIGKDPLQIESVYEDKRYVNVRKFQARYGHATVSIHRADLVRGDYDFAGRNCDGGRGPGGPSSS